MASEPFSFINAIFGPPIAVQAQNNQARLLQEQQAQTGQRNSAVFQEVNRLRQANPNMPPNALVQELLKSPTFLDAFTGDPQVFENAMAAIKATQAPGPEQVKLGQGDTLYTDGKPTAFGAGVDPKTGRLMSDANKDPEKVRTLLRLSEIGGLNEAETAAKARQMLTDFTSGAEGSTQVERGLRQLGELDPVFKAKIAAGLIETVTETDPFTKQTRTVVIDNSPIGQGGKPQRYYPEDFANALTNPRAAEGQPSQLPQQQTSGAGSGGGEIPPEGVRLLNAIAGTESPGYDVMNGGQRFSDMTRHPLKRGQAAKGGTTSASGRYQFVRGTWDEAAKALGLTDFSPASQDKGAWWLAQRDYKANTGRDLLTDLKSGNNEAIRKGLGSTWRGLADNPKKFLAAMGGPGSPTTGAENFQPSGAEGLNSAYPIGRSDPSSAWLTVGPVGSLSGTMERAGQILSPSMDTGATANEDYTIRQRQIDTLRSSLSSLGNGDQVSKYEAQQVEKTIANLEGMTSAQTALGALGESIKTINRYRSNAERILADAGSSPQTKQFAQERLNAYDEALQGLPTIEQIDRQLESVKAGTSDAISPKSLLEQGKKMGQQLSAPAQELGTAVEQTIAPTAAPSMDANTIGKMTLDQIKAITREQALAMTPEQREAFRQRIKSLQGGK